MYGKGHIRMNCRYNLRTAKTPRRLSKAVRLAIQDHVRLAAPEAKVLATIGQESRRKGTDKLTSREIDQIIKSARASS